MPPRIAIDRGKLSEFCQRHAIDRLSLFGSVLRDDFDPEVSDIDVLIQLAPDQDMKLTYFDLARMRFELEHILGRPVDLSMTGSLDPYLRDKVLANAEVQYDAA